jgi:uncharacterized protein (DUF362 family)
MHRRPGWYSRRGVLQRAAGVAGLLGLGALRAAGEGGGDKHRVGIAHCERALTGDGLDGQVIGEMIDRAVTWVTGTESADRAWASLFSSDEVVGIKPNGLAGYECSTAIEVVAHCVERLQGVGVRPNNILIWEEKPVQLEACGIALDDVPWGIRAYLTHDHLGDPVHNGSFEDRLFAPLQAEVDAILNLPILKCHPICGVTLAMKNHYGSIGNPAGQHHDQCHTPIVELSELPEIRDRTRLVVCDGTRALVEGQAYGQPQYFPDLVMAATDVVAHDAVGARLIEDERARRGLPPLGEVGLDPRYIRLAEERGLGVASLDAIETEVLELA